MLTQMYNDDMEW